MKCTKCIEENRTSKVYIGMTASTNAYYPPYYDENGVFHMHDNNRLVTEYQCDNLHKWTEARVGRCPNCDFGQNIKEITYG